VIRRAFDEAIMGPSRGRFAVAQLDKTEKAYIGLRVQLLLQGELSLEGGKKLDCLIEGHEVDIKFTLGSTWTIPIEARGELCLVINADEARARFSIGLLRMKPDVLNHGKNRDEKTTVSAAGREEVHWLAEDASMPPNFFLQMNQADLQCIRQRRAGQGRIDELFRRVQKRVIPRITICTLALQDDPMKRARDARKHLRAEGIIVLCGAFKAQAADAKRNGFDLARDEWLSLKSGI
jgi:hypothetical protein